MWNKQLAALAAQYSIGVLSVVDANGYPVSVRCVVELDMDRRLFRFSKPPVSITSWHGKACLLFHKHDENLESLRQLVILGELVDEEGTLVMHINKFVTANGRQDTDYLPHASNPFHMMQFMWLGWRSARAYIKRRGKPWPPIPYDEIDRTLIQEQSPLPPS